jgi:dTDP-glucose 4,6-dehydratase
LVFEQAPAGQTYNVGGNAERRNIDVVNGLCTLLDQIKPRADGKSYAEQISYVADRPGHDFRYAIDASKIRDQLGWTPQQTFETGLKATVDWYLAHEDWWRPLLDAGAGARLGLKS